MHASRAFTLLPFYLSCISRSRDFDFLVRSLLSSFYIHRGGLAYTFPFVTPCLPGEFPLTFFVHILTGGSSMPFLSDVPGKLCTHRAIHNGNRTVWSLIRSVIIRVITKSDDRPAGVRFVNHEYDYRLNWRKRCPATN